MTLMSRPLGLDGVTHHAFTKPLSRTGGLAERRSLRLSISCFFRRGPSAAATSTFNPAAHDCNACAAVLARTCAM